MSEKILNGAMEITLPEGFEVMSAQEMTALGDDPAVSFGARDKERHIILSVTAKKVPFLLGALADMPKVRDNSMRNVSKKVPGFVAGERFETAVSGQTAHCFRYGYTVQGVRQTGAYHLLKYKGFYYAVLCIGREENEAENREICGEFLEKIRLL